MRRFRSFFELRNEIEQVLESSKLVFQHSALEEVAQILCTGRHYPWVAIYLTVSPSGSQSLLEARADLLQPSANTDSRSRVLLSLKRGSREIGLLDVQTDRSGGFAAGELAFLERTADLLASYLAGRGKFLVRRAKEKAQQEVQAARHASR